MRSVATVLWIAAALISDRASAEEPGAPLEQTTVAKRAQPAKKRWQPGRWWFALGPSANEVANAKEGCGGAQVAAGLGGRAVFVKLQSASLSYQSRAPADSCDSLSQGDTSIREDAVLVGVSAPSSGLFVTLGPARVEFEENQPSAPVFRDTGLRIELGWSSRRLRNSRSAFGVEIVPYFVANSVHDYYGYTISLTIGAGGR